MKCVVQSYMIFEPHYSTFLHSVMHTVTLSCRCTKSAILG